MKLNRISDDYASMYERMDSKSEHRNKISSRPREETMEI